MPALPPRLEILLDLLHRCADAALATQSVAVPGYPFASALAFALDDRHRPVILISRLSEHTQNLEADPRASLLVHRRTATGDLARATLVGTVTPIEADPLLVARYLRYQPAAEMFLQLGDFRFFRLEPLQARIIGGFAQASWLAGERLTAVAGPDLAEERQLLDELAAAVPAGAELLGIDGFGLDLHAGGERRRLPFDAPPLTGDVLRRTALALLQRN
jgi:putative heme iron utilization protein